MALSPLHSLVHLAARGFGLIPEELRAIIAGEPVVIDGQTLDPSVKLMLKVMNAGGPTFETKPVAEGREELRLEAELFGTKPCVRIVNDFEIPGPHGRIPVRHYSQDTGEERGMVLYFHGGGWVLGGLHAADAFCRQLALDTGMQVLSVDYRLAPEHRFPIGLEDCIVSYEWLRDHIDEFGERAGSIVIAGESAGGNYTCVLAQQLKGEPLAGAVPIFPVTDLSRKSESYSLFSSGFFLTEAQMDWYKGHYLNDESEAFDPRVSPLLADDEAIRGLCPHVIVQAGFDPLRDEGRAYIQRLRRAGNDVEVLFFEGFIHGFNDGTAVGEAVTSRNRQINLAMLELARRFSQATSLSDV